MQRGALGQRQLFIQVFEVKLFLIRVWMRRRGTRPCPAPTRELRFLQHLKKVGRTYRDGSVAPLRSSPSEEGSYCFTGSTREEGDLETEESILKSVRNWVLVFYFIFISSNDSCSAVQTDTTWWIKTELHNKADNGSDPKKGFFF